MTPRRRSGAFRLVGALLLATCLANTIACTRKPPPPPPPEDQQLEQLTRAARDAFDEGNYRAAANLYRRALERAHIRSDFTAITDARYNLAVSLLKDDDTAGAADHLRGAKGEFSRANVDAPPEFALLEGTILFREGKPDQAREITEGILADERATPEVLGRTHYLRGRIADERTDPEGIRAAIDAIGRPDDPRLSADLMELQGRLALAEQRWDAAASALDGAAALHRRQLNYPAMAEALALSALAGENGGRFDLAAVRYLEAGRSAALRGDAGRARTWLTRAADLADRTSDVVTAGEVRDILAGMEESPTPD